jgi:hypothetical protein
LHARKEYDGTERTATLGGNLTNPVNSGEGWAPPSLRRGCRNVYIYSKMGILDFRSWRTPANRSLDITRGNES